MKTFQHPASPELGNNKPICCERFKHKATLAAVVMTMNSNFSKFPFSKFVSLCYNISYICITFNHTGGFTGYDIINKLFLQFDGFSLSFHFSHFFNKI